MQLRLLRTGLEIDNRHDRLVVTARNNSGFVFLIVAGILCLVSFRWLWEENDLAVIVVCLVILPQLILASIVLVPRHMVTVFERDGHRVVQTVRRFRRQSPSPFSFAEIASLGMKERYDAAAERCTHLPVITLKTGKSFPVGIRGVSVFEAEQALDAIRAATNLPRADIAVS